MHRGNLSRRGFLRRSLTGLAAAGVPAWYAREVLAARSSKRAAAARTVAANDRLTMGIIGIGSPQSRSLQIYDAGKRLQAAPVTSRLRRGRPPPASAPPVVLKKDGCKVSTHKDFRELLDGKDINAVIIATPDHWHALIAIEAMRKGKDVYCEKPLTLTVDEGQALVKVAKETGRDLPDRQPAALRVRRQVPPGLRAGPRRPHRQGDAHRSPLRRQPDQRPVPGSAGPRGAGLGLLARADAEGPVPRQERRQGAS